jgi:isopentenyldiphosphate isomerase
MKNDEYLDIVDEEGNTIGKELRKVLHHSPQKIHKTVNILIVNSKVQILVHQRSFTKQFGPGLWEISAGGHIVSGQTIEDAAREELLEELGIKSPLHFLEKKVFHFPEESELAHLFFGISEGPFTLNKEEIVQVLFINFDTVEKFLKQKNSIESMLSLWLPTIKAHYNLIFHH